MRDRPERRDAPLGWSRGIDGGTERLVVAHVGRQPAVAFEEVRVGDGDEARVGRERVGPEAEHQAPERAAVLRVKREDRQEPGGDVELPRVTEAIEIEIGEGAGVGRAGIWSSRIERAGIVTASIEGDAPAIFRATTGVERSPVFAVRLEHR
jgi:hypothetical protein